MNYIFIDIELDSLAALAHIGFFVLFHPNYLPSKLVKYKLQYAGMQGKNYKGITQFTSAMSILTLYAYRKFDL